MNNRHVLQKKVPQKLPDEDEIPSYSGNTLDCYLFYCI